MMTVEQILIVHEMVKEEGYEIVNEENVYNEAYYGGVYLSCKELNKVCTVDENGTIVWNSFL